MNKKGFSVLEAAIAIAIISVAFLVSLTMYTTLVKSTKLKTTARGIANILRQARAYAITENQPYYVFFEEQSPQRYYISDQEDGSAVLQDSKIYWLPEGIFFQRPDQIGNGIEVTAGTHATAKAACFKPTGELDEVAASSEYNIYVADDNANPAAHCFRISIQRMTGSVRINVYQ